MITPAYAPTATERVLPRLALDFTTGVLDPRVTVARALNTATRVNSSGLVEIVNADLPRFDYDPVTQAPNGLLIEEARTNNLLYSNTFDDPYYTATARATALPNSAISPDGTNNAYKLQEDSTPSSSHLVGRGVVANTQTAANYCASVFVKQAGRTQARLRLTDNAIGEMSLYVNLLDGTVVSSGAGTWTNFAYGVQDYGDGWYRIWVAGTKPNAIAQSGWAVYPAVGGSITYNGNGTDGIYIYGGGVESGLFPTSYIPTTTTSVTRNADVVTMTGTNFSSWYNASEGTFVFEGSQYSTATSRVILDVTNGTTAERIQMYSAAGGTPTIFIADGGVTQAQVGSATISANTTYKVSACYKENSVALSRNASAVVSDNSATIPTVDRTTLFCRYDSTLQLNGYARKLLYYPQRLLNAELQSTSNL